MKKTITESQLRQIVKESVKKALMEGKVVNNKPYFNYSGKSRASENPNSYIDRNQWLDKDSWVADGDYTADEIDRHNKRSENRPIPRDRIDGVVYRHSIVNDPKVSRSLGLSPQEWKRIPQDVQEKLINNFYNKIYDENPDYFNGEPPYEYPGRFTVSL